MPFDPRDAVAILLGLAGAKSGTPTGINTFMQNDLRAQEQQRRAEQDQRAAAAQQAQLQNMQADNTRQDAAVRDAQTARRMQFIQSLPGFLGDESIDSPDLLNSRMSMAENMGGQIGVEPGFIRKSFAVAPDKFAQRKAKKVVARIEGDKRFAQALAHPDFSGQIFEEGGERKTYAEWKAMAGQGGPAAGSPAMPPARDPNAPNTPEEQFYASYAAKLGKTIDKLTADERLAARKQWMQIDDRERPSATVLIQTVDPTGKPIQQFVKKEAGQTFAPAPSASQQTAMAEQEAGLDAIANIGALYKPEYVGPVTGRAAKAQMAIPGAPDVPQAVAEFHAAVAGLENEIIKLMSGAAVSGAEERRMRNQLPRVTDKPSVFAAKLAQTKRNRETLLSKTKQKAGQPAGAPQGEFMHPHYGRVRVVGTNPDGTVRIERVVP